MAEASLRQNQSVKMDNSGLRYSHSGATARYADAHREGTSSPDAVRTAGARSRCRAAHTAQSDYPERARSDGVYTPPVLREYNGRPVGPAVDPLGYVGVIGLLPEDSKVTAAAARKDVDLSRSYSPPCGSW